MNDLDLVRELRTDIPEPTQARLSAGRARLVAAISQPPSTPLRKLIIPVVAGAAAATIASTAIFGSGTGPTAHARPSTGVWAKAGVTLAARLLNAAAATVVKQPTVRPRPHQWFYTKFTQYAYGQGTTSDENWETFDGRWTAYYGGGKLNIHKTLGVFGGGGPTPLGRYNYMATPMTAYDALAALPSTPKALLAIIARQVAAIGGQNVAPGSVISQYAPTSHGELEFDYLAQLLWNSAMSEPSVAEAAVFRAMAAIPGVTIQQGITDVTGRRTIGLSANHGKSQLLLDPRTYQVIGMRARSTGKNLARTVTGKSRPWPAKGAVFLSMAWAQVTMVHQPGQR